MTRFATLLDLQQCDLAISQLTYRRAHLDERVKLRENEALGVKLRAEMAPVQATRADLGRTQKRFEDEVATVAAKRADIDKKLYSGTITNPKELQAFQLDEESLDRRRSHLEDEELDVMLQLEPIDEQLVALAARQVELDHIGAALRVAAAEADVAIDAELVSLRAHRAELVPAIDGELMALYDQLRVRLNPAVAPLKGSTCGGCHLSIPAKELDAIKHQPADALIQCEQCSCILVR